MAGAAALWLVQSNHPAFAEFEVPEVDGEQGTVEIEYRGAGHWGFPDADEDGEIDALRQSHEVEIQYAITDYWMLRVTPNFMQPASGSDDVFVAGLETQFVLIPRKDGNFGLAVMLGYEPVSFFVDVEKPDEIEFGPVAEFAGDKWLLTLNPRLTDDEGEFADQEGLGFEYAAQIQYRFAPKWSVAAMAFGEIEDLAHSGSFNAQTHALGPSLYWFSSADEANEEAAGVEAVGGEGRRGEWSVGLGTLFGLTSNTADVAVRGTLRMEF